MLSAVRHPRILAQQPEAAVEASAALEKREIPLVGEDIDRAYRLAGLILGDQHEAEDAAQEALLRAWQRRGSLRDREAWRAWFDRVLVNVCRDRLRARGRVKFVQPDLEMVGPRSQDPFREVLDRDEVLKGLQLLDDDCRIVVILHYWDDLTLEMIAKRTGWPVGTVKSRLHRALQLLRATIQGPAV